FVATSGSPVIHVLDVESGKEMKKIKAGDEIVESVACHPAKGLVYVSNENLDVLSIDPESGKVTKTKGAGQRLVVERSDGGIVYTSIYRPAKNVLLVQDLPGGQMKMQLVKGGAKNILLKFQAKGADLKCVAGNDNGGAGNSNFSVSRDGKFIAM